jgi:excisionase family DNA binding protein
MKLLRVDEAAHILGLRPSTIRKLIYQRQLHVVRPTKRAVRLREDDIEALCRAGYISQEVPVVFQKSGNLKSRVLPGRRLSNRDTPDEKL